MPIVSVEADVDVDIDDVIWEMSSAEKKSLCIDLIENGYGPDPIDNIELDEVLEANTYSDRELIDLFKEMWRNRIHIDHKLVDELRVQLRDRNII